MNDAAPPRSSLASTLDQILRGPTPAADAAPLATGTLVKLGLLLGALYDHDRTLASIMAAAALIAGAVVVALSGRTRVVDGNTP